jgi:nucleoside-diphosphate kinase
MRQGVPSSAAQRRAVRFAASPALRVPRPAQWRASQLIKPDGVMRGFIADIISRFERKGLKLVAMQFMQATPPLMQQLYAQYRGQPWYNTLISFMCSGPIVACCWEGLNAVATGLAIAGPGPTQPLPTAPGTIRGDYALSVSRLSTVAGGSHAIATPAFRHRFCVTSMPPFSFSSGQTFYDLVHASATTTAAPGEIAIMFPAGVTEWTLPTQQWIYGQ